MFISLCSNLLVKCTQVAGARKAAGLERGVHDADVQDRVAPGEGIFKHITFCDKFVPGLNYWELLGRK